MWIPPAYSPVSPLAALRAAVAAHPEERLRACLRERFGGARVHLVASGTAALRLAIERELEAASKGRGVALPAYGCYDLVSAAMGASAPVVFYDVDPETLGPEPESLERATAASATVVVANLYGFPVDWDLVRAVCREHGRRVIEDAAQAIGSRWRERAGGTLGDVSVISFGRGKGWTGGGGGALLEHVPPSDRDPTVERSDASALRVLAGTLAQWALARPSLYGLPARMPWLGLGATHFRPPEPPAAIHASMASHVWSTRDRAAAEVAFRRVHGERLGRAWDVLDRARPRPLEGGEPSYLRLPLFLPRPSPTPDPWPPLWLLRAGVYGGYPRTLPDLASSLGLDATVVGGDAPGARLLARELVTAPTHSRSRAAVVTEAFASLTEAETP